MFNSQLLKTLSAAISGPVNAMRLARQLREVPRPSEAAGHATAAEIAQLVDHQLGVWREAAPDRASLHEAYRALNEAFINIFVFEIKNRKVTVWAKPQIAPPEHMGHMGGYHIRFYAGRMMQYRALLQAVVTAYAVDSDFTVALDVDDTAADRPGTPVFAFQKPEGSRCILIPDVDFFKTDWYAGNTDTHRYEDKAIKACFAGASTGGRVLEETITQLHLPRLRAAAHFLDSPLVDFRIARAAQCDTPAARALLLRQPYFGEPMSWDQQFAYRFIISMDGNGATCSRVAIALRSNSVLVKYRSPFGLYYFPAMVAGRDYIEVTADPEIAAIVQREREEPGHFKTVAETGRSFAIRYLNKASVLHYTAALLKGFAGICGR